MNGDCATLLIFLVWAGISTAKNLGENQELTKRVYYQSGCSPCSGIICSNGGTCGLTAGRPECNCATNYVGVTCNTQLTHSCDTHSCLFKRSFDAGRNLGKWWLRDLHYPSVNLLIAKLHKGQSVTLTTGYIFWGRKTHNLFFRVRFYNALYKQGSDNVVVTIDDPYIGLKTTLKTVQRSDYPNDSTTKEFCVRLPKTYKNYYAVSFTINCLSTKCAEAVWDVDITEIALQGITVQESTAC